MAQAAHRDPATDAGPSPDPGLRRARALLAAASALMVAVVLYAGRDLSFFYDEWSFLLGRRSLTVANVLDGHNGHLSALPVLVYQGLRAVFGMRHYGPYQLVLAAVHVSAVWMLFELARRRIGAWPALVPATLLLVLGTAYDDLVWAFQIGFVGSIAAGLAALVALDRDTPRGDRWAGVWLLVALCSSSPAIPFVVLVTVDLALRRDLRRLVRVLWLPVTLYGLWYFGWGTGGPWPANPFDISAVKSAPDYMMRMLVSGAQGLSGYVQAGLGPALAVLFVALLVVAVVRQGAPPRLIAVVAAALAFWALTAVTRARFGQPDAPRYLYPTAVFLLLMAVEMTAFHRAWLAALPRRAAVVTGFLVAAAAVGGVGALGRGAGQLEIEQRATRAHLAAVRIAAAYTPAGFQPDALGAPPLRAGPWLAAIARWGTDVPDARGVPSLPPHDRTIVDSRLTDLEFTGARPVPAPAPGECLWLPAGGEVPLRRSLVVVVPSGSRAALRLRRFGDRYPKAALATLRGGATRIAVRPDRAAVAWTARITPAAGVRVCRG